MKCPPDSKWPDGLINLPWSKSSHKYNETQSEPIDVDVTANVSYIGYSKVVGIIGTHIGITFIIRQHINFHGWA